MKTAFKWIFRLVLVLVFLIAILAIALKFFIDPNDYKDEIQTSFEDTIGRPVEINGQIEWSLYPWLAIALNEVKIANEKGYKGDYIADINRFSARVKILPLFKKSIEVGKVVINQGDLNLQVSKKGKSNWQGILDHMNSEPSAKTETTDSTPNELKIEGIELKNINLNYKDAQAKTAINLKDLNFTTGKITDGKSVAMEASMLLEIPDSGLNASVSTDLIANNLLSEAGGQFQVNDFSFKGSLNSSNQLPLEISIDDGALIDLAKDSLSIPELEIDLGDAQIKTNVEGSNITQNLKLNGKYKLSTLDFNKFVKQLTGAAAVNSDVFSNFNSQGQWSMQGDGIKFDDLFIAFADTEIKGKADIKNIEQLRGQFDLKINKLDIDKFLGEESTESSSSSTSDTGELNFGRLSGSVSIDKLTASGTTMDNITMKVLTNNSKMSISPVRADFYQGLLETVVDIDTKAVKDRIRVKHKMKKIQAGPLLTDVMGSQLMTGLGQFDLDVKIDKPFSEVPLKTAHGSIDFSLGDGAIYGVDVFGMMNQGLSLLYPEVMKAQNNGEKKTSFALMAFKAKIDQGILKSETLKVESPFLKIDGNITVNLFEQTIEGYIEPMLIDIPDELVSDKYKKLLNLPIPVSLSGSLLEPKVKIDAKKLLLATQKEKIEKEKEKLKGKLLDSLFGKDKD